MFKGRFSHQSCVNISYPAFFFSNLYLLDTYSLVGKEIQHFVLKNQERLENTWKYLPCLNLGMKLFMCASLHFKLTFREIFFQIIFFELNFKLKVRVSYDIYVSQIFRNKTISLIWQEEFHCCFCIYVCLCTCIWSIKLL